MIHTQLHRLTFRRQALVTTCLGSTTSTRGSLMATLRMQLMSNPYTFSHPVQYTHNINIRTPIRMHFVDFHFSEFFVQSSDLSVPAELYAGREGSREGETKCLTLPGNSPALTPSFCIYSPPPLRWGRRALLKIDSGFLHLLRRVWQAFFIIIWTGNTPSWIFLPQSLCPSTPPCFVRGPNIKSEQWEGGICHWCTEKLKIKCARVWVDWILLGFMWKYVIEQRRPPVQ